MTEYWKSQARKYCDFCKCWLADNKVSISFHENGKRHKENVQKHISQLSKRSAKEFKQKEKIDDEIQKMEAAAMAAYMKDVQNNADLTSQSINEMLGKSSGIKATESSSGNAPMAVANTKAVWHEVKSEKGNYFWNTETSETIWDPPDEYLSIAEQEEQELKQKEKEKKIEKQGQIMKKQKKKELQQEINAHKAREKMRELAVKKEEPVPSSTTYGPAARGTKPYGSWTAVVTEPAVQVDFQLPKFEKRPPPPAVVHPEEVIKFKEKKLELLGDGPVEFKKRKLNNHKRNIRQKFDDE